DEGEGLVLELELLLREREPLGALVPGALAEETREDGRARGREGLGEGARELLARAAPVAVLELDRVAGRADDDGQDAASGEELPQGPPELEGRGGAAR